MNTYYYGYRAQKEAIEEIGTVVTLPIKRLYGFSFYSDSTKIAITGQDDKEQGDMSLYILERDTTKELKAREERKKAKEETEKDAEKTLGFFAKLFGKDEEEDNEYASAAGGDEPSISEQSGAEDHVNSTAAHIQNLHEMD